MFTVNRFIYVVCSRIYIANKRKGVINTVTVQRNCNYTVIQILPEVTVLRKITSTYMESCYVTSH